MEQTQLDTARGWFAGRLPEGWFETAPEVSYADEQLKVVGTLAAPAYPEGASDAVRAGAEAGRIARFREETRRYRVWIAREAEHRFEVNVQWGARCGGTATDFNPGGSGRGRHDGDKGDAQGGQEPRPVEI